MDLRVSGPPPTPAERAAVDAVVGPDGGPAKDARPRRDLLLPALLSVQSRVGWVSEGALAEICRRLHVPPADAFGVASFYRMIALAPQPAAVAHVCEDLACRLKGAETICHEMERRLGPPGAAREGSAGNGRAGTWHRSACLGLCEVAPAALVIRAGENPEEIAAGDVSAADVVSLLEMEATPSSREAPAARPSTLPQSGDPSLRLLRRVGRVDPESLAAYRESGGFEALARAREIGPEKVIAEVAVSKLLGRGGAAFPTARKWEAVARQPARPHYLVCNADESEPGTFKDRVLLEEDPFVLVEAMAIAAFATGCGKGYIYIRGEYPRAARRLTSAVDQARSADLLGGLELEIRRGGGAYICGEETALFNSIEGFRGEPRNKPPFPVTHGLFGKPTVINNVETLANVPEILREGGAAFASRGTPESTGTRLFCLSGRVARPGIYEVAMGTPLAKLLDLAGGVPGGGRVRAVLLGGAAGSFLAPGELDVPLSFEGTRKIGATLGSGAVIVLDETVDPWDFALRIAAFFREESCGQCVPCRVGTIRQEEALRRLAAKRPLGSAKTEAALLREIAQAMRDASICGLGQTAASAIQSAVSRLDLVPGETP
jgi:NADH-quinone oxidoreductase subunit F